MPRLVSEKTAAEQLGLELSVFRHWVRIERLHPSNRIQNSLDLQENEMTEFTPTQEQQAIVEAAAHSPASLMVKAFAGCAKTSTLKLLAPGLPTRSVICLAFNKKIALDLTATMPEGFTCATLNSVGHKAFASAVGRRLIVDSQKVSKLVTEWSKKLGRVSDVEWAAVRNLVVKAKSAGLVPSRFPEARRSLIPDTTEGWEEIGDSIGVTATQDLIQAARDILSKSIDLARSGTIDYDDQIYMSALFFGLYPKFHTVIGDEVQDWSLLNHLQVKKMTGERLIVVGDPLQSIYAFRGADSASMEKIRRLRPEWIDLPLTTTFRCPRVIVQRQQRHAPGFNAAESAPEGQVLNWQGSEGGWSLGDGQLPDAILCRNNAPLIGLAFKLLRKRVGINVLGRDFGKSIVGLLKKLCGEEGSRPSIECLEVVTQAMEKEIRLARAAGKDEKISQISDRHESLIAVLEETDSLGSARRWLEELFDRPGQITLSSIHKAKGLEWNTVLHLDPWRLPSKYARLAANDGNDVPLEQELNLQYVCETRAKQTLILANLEDFK